MDKLAIFDAGTVHDAVRIAENRKTTPYQKDGHQGHSVTGSKKFTGSASMDEALQLADYGWPDGLARITAGIDHIKLAENLNGVGIEYDLAGDEADVGRYLSGEPENMICWKRTIEPKCISLEVNMGYSAATEDQQITNRGAAIAALVDQLEATNRRVEIRLTIGERFSIDKKRPRHIAHTWLLKESQDVISTESLAFWLMHPSAFRRIGFAVMEEHDFGWDMNYESYGTPLHTAQADDSAVFMAGLANGTARDYDTPVDAFETVKKIARDAGIEME